MKSEADREKNITHGFIEEKRDYVEMCTVWRGLHVMITYPHSIQPIDG